MAKAVFLDRDETLNPDPGYINDPALFELFPWVAAELARLKKAGFLLIVVSNQSGLARGLIQWKNLIAIHEKLNAILQQQGNVTIDDFAICSHIPDDLCECRKPKPKLILDAATRHQIDLSQSFMIGDRKSDFEAGKAAHLKKSFLINPGDEPSFKAAIKEILETSLI